MKLKFSLVGLGSLVAFPAQADLLNIDIELPRFTVAEYHKPYVAIWVSRLDHSVAANLSVWYQLEDGPEGEGETWLKDMRQWWRSTGRSLNLPIDGVSTPTRAPGQHTLQFDKSMLQIKDLEPGEYFLCVEAAREVGGREMVRLPFYWKGSQDATVTVSGETELGTVTLKITSESES